MKHRHHFGHLRRARRRAPHARPLAHVHVVGETAHVEVLLAAVQHLHHARPHVAAQQIKHRPALHRMAQRPRFFFKQTVEFFQRHLARFKQRPGVGFVIAGVHAAQKIFRQALFGLETGKGIERRRRKHAAEIPQNGFESNDSLGSIDTREWAARHAGQRCGGAATL